ncbi:MAG TPA: hypothetical protein VL635_20810 [Trinickia sp.]|nr:hypothetical protein [Trinickia sp.]
MSNASPLLPPPDLPQAADGILNLAELDADAVRVNVPAYMQCNFGDQIALIWVQHDTRIEITRRYAYLADTTRDQGRAPHEVRIRPLWALPPGDYDVQYAVTSRTGNVSQSSAAHVEVVGTPDAPTVIAGGVIQTELFGIYPPGLIGAWIAPAAYSIESSNDILVQSLASYSAEGASAPNSVLRLYKNKDVNPFASIVSDGAGTRWTPSVDEPTTFIRGDLISVRLEGTQDSALFLVLAV